MLIYDVRTGVSLALRWRRDSGAILALAVGVAAVTLPGQAVAAPGDPISRTFTYAMGPQQTFPVPAFVAHLRVTSAGGGGGDGDGGSGAPAGIATVPSLAVTPNETVQLNLGPRGNDYVANGNNPDSPGPATTTGGGAVGGAGPDGAGGGGGGASDVRRPPFGLADRLVVGGGGGAGGGDGTVPSDGSACNPNTSDDPGGDGGTGGGDPANMDGPNGGAGTPSQAVSAAGEDVNQGGGGATGATPGIAGTSGFATAPGVAGGTPMNAGGSGGGSNPNGNAGGGGGGGGGGYAGGGGGANGGPQTGKMCEYGGGGGGGGSSFGPPGTTYSVSNDAMGNPLRLPGQVVITYTQPTPTATTAVADPDPAGPNSPVTLTATVASGTAKLPAPSSGTVQFAVNGTPRGAPLAVTGGAATLSLGALAPGAYTVTAAYSGGDGYMPSSGSLVETVSAVSPNPSATSSPGPRLALAPHTLITLAPGALVASRSVRFAFSSDQAGSVFACSLDRAPATACTSPLSLPGLHAGTHTLSARAIGPSGLADPNPAVVRFTVDVYGPPLLLLEGGALHVDRRGRVVAQIECGAREFRGPCTGSATLRRSATNRVLGRAPVRLVVNRITSVQFVLGRQARAEARQHAGLHVRLVLHVRDGAGNATTLSALRTITG